MFFDRGWKMGEGEMLGELKVKAVRRGGGWWWREGIWN